MIKFKQLHFLLLFILLGFVACSGDDEEEVVVEPKEDINPYFTGEDMSSTYSLNNDYEKGDEVFYVLGYGYDITGKYAHPNWVKASVIDVGKLAKEKEEEFFIYKGSPHPPSVALGFIFGTKIDVVGNLCTKKRILKEEKEKYPNRVFESMLTPPFQNDTSFKDVDYYYSFLSNMSGTLEYGLMARDADRKEIYEKYLSKDFLDDLILMSGEEIIAKYGTHILMGIVLGKREDYIYRSSSSSGNQLQLGLLARSEEVFEKKPIFWWSVQMEKSTSIKENIYYEIIGSKAPKINAWMVDYTNFPENKIMETSNYDEMEVGDAVLIDFFHPLRNVSPLTPIYEAIEDRAKKEEVQKAFQDYLNN